MSLASRLNLNHLGIRAKLVLALASLIGVIALFIYIYFPARLERQASDALAARAHGVADMIAYSAGSALFFEDQTAGTEIAAGALRDVNVRYVVITDSSKEIFVALRIGQADRYDFRTSSEEGGFTTDKTAYRNLTPIEYNGHRIGNLYVGFSCDQLNSLIADSRSAVAMLCIAIFLGGFVVVFAIGTLTSGPILQMVEASEDIASGNLSRRAEVHAQDEIGRLATAFNNMVGSLQSAQIELHDHNRLLEVRVERRTRDLRQEVDERRRAEESLEAQSSFLLQVIDINPNYIFVKDHEGRFTLVNQAMSDAFGASKQDIIGKTSSHFNPNEEEVLSFRRDDLRVMATLEEHFVPEEIVTDYRGRKRWWQSITRPIISRDGVARQVLGVSTDITERRETEIALRTSEDLLRQATKMEAIGRLAGGVAHDFNNILAVIMGRSEALLAEMESTHPLIEPIREIDSAATRAASLTRQLLAFSRRQVLEARPLNLNSSVEHMEKMLQRLIGANIQFSTILEPTLGTVFADPGQIEQVLMNLAVNARDAMPEGGRLTMRTDNRQVGDLEQLTSPGLIPGQYVVISVADTGHGMDEATRSHIFEPFFTTKGPGKGTGLGLSTVYGIVRQSNGHVIVDSSPGRGTTFTILLPRTEAVVEDAVVEQSLPDTLDAVSGQTILLVEDEDGVRLLVEQTLTLIGYRILAAANGAEALDIADHDSQVIDLVITDVMMPGLSGPDVVERLQQSRPNIRVIFMSGYADIGAVNEKILEAHHVLLQKPFRLDALRKVVASTLAAPEVAIAE